MKKQKLCAPLCAVFLMSCVHLDVWAESFNDEIAGIQYESIEELQSCIKTHSLMKSSHQSQSALLSSMSQLFLPEVLCDHLNEIEQILVTPTYVSVNFEEDGQKLEFRHYPSGEQEYQLAQERQKPQANPIYDYQPVKREVNGYPVYSSYSGATEYCWEQEGEVFVLRTFDETDAKGRRNFHLCKSASVPLYESISAKDPAAQQTVQKKEKVFFRAIDQNGNPITDAQFVLPALQTLVPTNSAGKTWYSGKPFEKQTVTLYYSDSYGNRRNTSKIVTIEDSHLQNGKMGITFKVTI